MKSDYGETVHNHTGPECDPNVCPNDQHCRGMQSLHYCVPVVGADNQFECHHLNDEGVHIPTKKNGIMSPNRTDQ